jgi:NADH dehydrogenase
MRNILVLGGSGFLGRAVTEKLVERSNGAGGRITVPTRHPARARHVQMLPTVETVSADVHDDATLSRLVKGRDAVINLIAILHGNDAAFERVQVALPQRLAEACLAAGVRRVIHVSSLGAASEAPSKYLRSKAAGEAALGGRGLHLTVLRPSVMFGEHDRFVNTFARLQAVFPIIPLAGASAQLQPVWVEDVGEAIARSLDDRSAVGQTIECAGPKVWTLRQIVHCAGAWSGHPRPIIGLAPSIARLQALAMELLPGEPLMSRDNLDSLKVANVASGLHPGLDALGIHAASLEGVMAPLLGHHAGISRLDPWRAAAGR